MIPFKLAFLDARLQGMAQAIGAQRPYFYAREGLRVRLEKVDTTLMREKGAVFVHVPKCAGTTIITQLPIAAGHRSATFMKRYDPDLWDSAFTFGFSRSPYDRLPSAFHYLRSDKTSARDKSWGEAYLKEFADFGAFMEGLQSRRVRQKVLGWLHFLPQTNYLCDKKGKVIVDFVGRTDDFASGLAEVNQRLGTTLENRHERKVTRSKAETDYDAKGRRLVADLYAEDFETFQYPT